MNNSIVEFIPKETPAYYAIIPANVRYDKRLPANAKLLFGELTALTNKTGYCWANNKYFSDLYGVHEKTISKWVNTLYKLGYINRKIEDNYRRLIHINVGVPQKADGGTAKRLQGVPQKADNNSTSNTTYNNTVKRFDELWNIYPLKKGKKDALRNYAKIISKTPEKHEQIKAAIENYLLEIKTNNTDIKYVKHGNTFMNNWEDYLTSSIKKTRWNTEFKGWDDE